MLPTSFALDPQADLELILHKPDSNGAAAILELSIVKPEKAQPIIVRPEIEKQDEVQFLVSSKHVKQAFSVLMAMLDGPWKEGQADDKSRRSITASD